ncbi:MAG: nucleotidyl transferase AbiEii/AbiGii toxin family protein [Bacteroidota bacterium]
MHKEILSETQVELLPLVSQFKREFYLVGGTAIALYIGHRRSIDFDLFKFTSLHPKNIITKIVSFGFPYLVTRRVTEQLNMTINDVKFTFFEYPFQIEAKNTFEDFLRIPTLLDLAAMKAYALGRRSKWKDYVDFYFLLKDHFSIGEISERAVEIYDQLFSPKLFRAQLSFFQDINYIETVEYLLPVPSDEEIRQFLIDKALDI